MKEHTSKELSQRFKDAWSNVKRIVHPAWIFALSLLIYIMLMPITIEVPVKAAVPLKVTGTICVDDNCYVAQYKSEERNGNIYMQADIEYAGSVFLTEIVLDFGEGRGKLR